MSSKKSKTAATAAATESAIAENNTAATAAPKKRTRKPAAKNAAPTPVEEVKVAVEATLTEHKEEIVVLVTENTADIALAQEEIPEKETKTTLKKEYKALRKVYKTAKKVTRSFKKILKKVSKKEPSDIVYSTNLDYAEAKGSKKILKRNMKALKATIKNFKKK